MTRNLQTSKVSDEPRKVKMFPAPERIGDRVLIKNTYLVEFAVESGVKNHFKRVARSLKAFHQIPTSAIKKRCTIDTSLFSRISFTLTVDHSHEALEMIQDAIAIHPVYAIQRQRPIIHAFSSKILTSDANDSVVDHGLTGVNEVHEKLQNFGKGVRVRKVFS